MAVEIGNSDGGCFLFFAGGDGVVDAGVDATVQFGTKNHVEGFREIGRDQEAVGIIEFHAGGYLAAGKEIDVFIGEERAVGGCDLVNFVRNGFEIGPDEGIALLVEGFGEAESHEDADDCDRPRGTVRVG